MFWVLRCGSADIFILRDVFMGMLSGFRAVVSAAVVATFFVVSATSKAEASSVAVHDPSVIVVYKDAAGNSYPENDAGKTREKFYYIFGTMNGGAYSRDMLDWTPFTPKLSRGGVTLVTGNNKTDDYYTLIKAEADYAEHTTSATALGNFWAPDIVWNKKMKKWCLYFSEAGEDWKSSIILFTSSKIEGPYDYVGSVVYGGMDNQTAGSAANADYQKVTGSATIDSRYYMANDGVRNLGKWDGGYGVSAIDPSVFYDEDGILWLLYGSWSGGLFLLKLDESTGLRDYSYKYETKWQGEAFKSAMTSDQYMGIHVGGGYYVSGEGSYIQYFKDADGNGYYYLFISYGFYSPDGGYTMRVFRSKDVKGPYVDVDGTSALFSKYIYNYGTNTEYGFPIIQNYKWSFWPDGSAEIADGHNSLLRDDDGSMYLVYHRKMDNGTAWHNVETHQLYFNKMGWIVAAPFEYKTGFGMTAKAFNQSEIAGAYKIIMHEPYAQADNKFPINTEKDLQLNADGSVTGAYTGTWKYDFAKGRQYITFEMNNNTYEGVLLEQSQNDVGKVTLTFSAMNKNGSRALWGYRVPKTETVNETRYFESKKVVGTADKKTAWDAYDDFAKVSVSGDFVAEFDFTNYTEAKENWNNWVLAFKNGESTWYLRSDAYSVETFSGSNVGYYGSWGSDWEKFKTMFKNAKVKVRAVKDGSAINVYAFLTGAGSNGADELVYRVSATNAPSGNYDIYLGADAAYLDVSRIAYGSQSDRIFVGTLSDGGIYNAGFNALKSSDYKASGDFNVTFNFRNYGNGAGSENWDNYIVRATADGKTTLLRADAYAMDNAGTFDYKYDWNWDDFKSIMQRANVSMNISRKGDAVTYNSTVTAADGKSYSYKAVNAGASKSEMAFGFTCEKSGVDLLRIAANSVVGDSTKFPEVPESGKDPEETPADTTGVNPPESSGDSTSMSIRDLQNSSVKQSDWTMERNRNTIQLRNENSRGTRLFNILGKSIQMK